MTDQREVGDVHEQRCCLRGYSLGDGRSQCHRICILTIHIPALLDVLTRSQRKVTASLNRHILTLDLHITVRCTDGNAREGIDLHITPRRLDADVTVIGTTLDAVEAVLVRQLNVSLQVRTLFEIQTRK